MVGSLFYIIVLQWAYPAVLVPIFSYSGMVYRSQSPMNFVVQYVLAWLPSLWLPRELDKPSQYQNWILYITVVVPTCILPYHVTALPARQIGAFLGAITVCFAGLCTVSRLRPIKINYPQFSPRLYASLLGAITIVIYLWLILHLGFSSFFLPIDQVYIVRTELRSANIPVLLGYLIWVQGAVVNPMICAAGFYRRRWLLVLLSTLLQVQLYSLTSLRFFMAAAAFAVGIGFFELIFRRARGVAFLYSIILSSLGAVIWNLADQRALGPLLFLERWIFNSGQLSGYYLEFFSRHPFAGLQHSSIPMLRWLFPGSYDLPIGQIIGREYFIQATDGVYTNATAHFWADGFASFGYSGIVAATVVAFFLLWLVDSAASRQERSFAIMTFSVVGLSLTGQSVLTTVLTGGVAAYVFLILIGPRYRPANSSSGSRFKCRPDQSSALSRTDDGRLEGSATQTL